MYSTGVPATLSQCPLRKSGFESRAFLPPSAYLNDTTCTAGSLLRQSDDLVLVNAYGSTVPAAFDCQALPKCEVYLLTLSRCLLYAHRPSPCPPPYCVQLTCAGPDPALVEVVTKHCSCMVEWYSYGGVIQTLLACLAYLLMNVSR